MGKSKYFKDLFLENEVKLLEQAKQEIQEGNFFHFLKKKKKINHLGINVIIIEINEYLALEKARKYNSFFPLLFQRLFRFLVVIFCIYQVIFAR
jgi:hypothetical protein